MSRDPFPDARCLNDVLASRAAAAEAEWLTLYKRDSVADHLNFGDLGAGALGWAGCLHRAGVEAGDRVALVLPTARGFYTAYWGVLAAGAVPVPAYPPVRLNRLEEYLANLGRILDDSGAVLLLSDRRISPLIRPVRKAAPELRELLEVEDADLTAPLETPVERAGSDLGLLQYTSGSTGRQKGVSLSHANLLANLRAMGEALELGPEDRAVSWLPLYHDMGLIGMMLGSVYWGIPLAACSPIDFLRRPVRWLRRVTEHRATLTAGPNFAYSLTARKVRDRDLEELDLSGLRLALCGAEPIHPATVDRFVERFTAVGFREEAFFAAYGLAENTLAVTFSDLGVVPRRVTLDAERLDADGVCEPARPDHPQRTLVSVGRPIPGVQLRLADADGHEVASRVRGEIQVSGPSVMQGYFRNPEATADAVRGGWLRTGDLGFLEDGYLYVCGRAKDLVIKAGRNYFAEDLEAVAERVTGVRPGGSCVFSVDDAERGTEEVVLVVESSGKVAADPLVDAVRREVAVATGCRPDRVLPVPAHTLPKTSSGKLQRFRVRDWYRRGELATHAGERRTTGLWTYLKAWLRDKLERG